MAKPKLTGENLAFNIELICEKILENVTDLEDLKNLSRVNPDWYSRSQKYLEAKSLVKLKNHQLLPFFKWVKKHGWHKKNIAINYLANNPTRYNYNSHGYKPEDIDKVLERLPKIGDKVISLQLQIDYDMSGYQIFIFLSECQKIEKLQLSFIRWDPWMDMDGDSAVGILPSTFPFLKQLVIEDYQSTGWEFCHHYLLETIPLSCQSVKLSGWGQDTGGFLLSMNELLPRQLEQFTSIDINNQILPETWKLLTEGNLFQLTDFVFSVNDSDVEDAETFLERYKNQLTSLGLHLFLEHGELKIPEMNNLKSLDLHWYPIYVLKTNKVKIEDGREREVCAYPKLRKLIVHGKVNDDGKELMACLSDIAIRGMGQRVSKILLDLHLRNSAYHEMMLHNKEEKRRNEVQVLFPNAEIEFDYLQLHKQKIIYKVPKFPKFRLGEIFLAFFERIAARPLHR